MAVSVVVSNFNGAKYLPRLLETLSAQAGVRIEIIVVDRNSTDASAEILKRYAAVKVVNEPPETGLVAGYHCGIQHAVFEHLFFCNEDMWFEPNCLARLEEQIDLSSKVACADPWQWSYDGSRIIHSAPQIGRGWNRSEIHPFYSHRQNQEIPTGHIVAGACAGAMMIHRSAYEDIGGWDTTFFLDYEDTDLEIRLWQRGWLTTVVPEARVYHDVGASNSKTISEGKMRVGEKRYIHGKSNQLVAAWKTFSPFYCSLPLIAWLESIARDILKLRMRRAKWDLQALVLTLSRLPAVFRFRRFNRSVNRTHPGERFFKEPMFQFGALVRPSKSKSKDLNEKDKPAIQLSVALVTRNRANWLRGCLQSWRSQSVLPVEIVVSDDSDPEYAEDVKKTALEFDCHYVRGPRRGLYANRNNAALACRGTHIMSADDDHTHPPDFIETVLADIAVDSECVWTYGERYPRCPDEPLIPPPELTSDNRIAPPREGGKSGAIADGSSAYPRTIFERGLRYDETYPFGGLWYLWGQRLAREGYLIRFSPRTFVWHNFETIIERSEDAAWTQEQLECSVYVAVRNGIREHASVKGALRAVAVIVRCLFLEQSLPLVKIRTRLGVASITRAIKNAFSAP